LNNFSFENIDEYNAILGKKHLWIANYPYSAFIPCERFIELANFRASRKTIFKAMKKLIEDRKTSNEQIK